MQIKNIKINEKSEFTRKCIGEAIIILLKNTEFSRLKISDIVKKAGVSRTTFYKYYTTPYSVLKDYLNLMVSEYILKGKNIGQDSFFNYDHIIFSFNFFDQYAEFFLTLSNNKLHSVLLDGINEFMISHLKPDKSISMYKLYSYAGALLNSFLKWEENGKKEKVEDIARTLENFIS